MNDVRTLLSQCQELGAEFIPLPDGKLKVRAPRPLPETLREELRRRKGEVLTFLCAERPGSVSRPTPKNSPVRPFYDDAREDQALGILPWSCPACGEQVRLDPPVTEELPTRFWSCQSCQAWGATREGAFAPVVWVTGGSIQ
jgi:hypothetical protein